MRGWVLRIGGVLLVGGACACARSPDADRVDLLLVGGAVYTLDWPAPDSATGRPSPASSWTEAHGWRPDAGAVAVAAGRIVWLGSEADANRWRERADRVVELAGAAVLPGYAAQPAPGREPLRERLDSARGADSLTVEQVVRAVTEADSLAGGDLAEALRVGGPAHLLVVEPDPFRTPREVWLDEGRLMYTVMAGRLRPVEGGR